MGKAKKGQLYIRFSKEGRAQAETSQSDGIDRVNIYIIFAWDMCQPFFYMYSVLWLKAVCL